MKSIGLHFFIVKIKERIDIMADIIDGIMSVRYWSFSELFTLCLILVVGVVLCFSSSWIAEKLF